MCLPSLFLSHGKERLRAKSKVGYLSTLSMARLTVLALVCFSILCLSSAGGKKGCKKPKRIRPVFLKESNCECGAKITGRMKQQDGEIFFCDGSEWKALAFETKLLGSKENPGSSCGDIKTNEPRQNTNGVYWISSTKGGETVPVYCDMEAGGWTMVFKILNNAQDDAYTVYTSGGTYAETEIAALDVTNFYSGVYKNEIVINWNDFGPTEARVALFKGGSVVKEMMFDATGSDKLSWFSRDKLTGTLPWADIKGSSNFFSIIGDTGNSRRFFINKAYGGCPGDEGWMVIGGPNCDWEKNFENNAILYSKLSTATKWQTPPAYVHIGEADVLAVFVRR